MDKILYFIGFLVCLFFTKKLKDRSVNNSLIEIYNATNEEDEERFLKALQQKGLKAFVSAFTITFMKLKFYVNCDNYEKVQEILNEFKFEKLKFLDKLAINQLMFSYSVERNDYEQIQYYYSVLSKDLSHKETKKFQTLISEIELIYSIFVKKDYSLIRDLEARIEVAKDSASLAILHYYKARLYYAKGDINQCKKDLNKSIGVSKNSKWKNKIENILNSNLIQLN